jgi:hypothetical protein
MKFILLLSCVFTILIPSYSQILTPTIISDKCVDVVSNITLNSNPDATTVSSGRNTWGIFSLYRTYRTLVEFNLSTIPDDAIILSAQLKLCINSTSATPPSIRTARITGTWAENAVSFFSHPSYTTIDQMTSSSITSAVGMSWLTVDVKTHVQKMIADVYENRGWVLYHSNELESSTKIYTFRSDDYAGTDYDPKLEITYYVPMSVSDATIGHASGLTESDGSVTPSLLNGAGGTYTYNWYDASNNLLSTSTSSPNLTGVPYGWYGLEVVSSTPGSIPFYYAFLVGVNCEEVSIEFNPDGRFVDDAVVRGPSGNLYETTNYGTDQYETALDLSLLGGNTQYRSLIKFRLWIDEDLNFSESTLLLKGFAGGGDRSDATHLKRITENWNESIVTHSSLPATSSDIIVTIPDMASPTELKNVDIINFSEFWQTNNHQNNGFLFELQLYNTVLATQSYHSSDATNPTVRPKINFKGTMNSGCLSYSEMKRKLDGGYSYAVKGKLKFTMDEEYEMEASKYLPFRIYDKDHVILESSDIDGVVLNSSVAPLPLKFDDNRWTLNVSSIPGMTIGEYYILEVSNSKGDRRYLRFLYKN